MTSIFTISTPNATHASMSKALGRSIRKYCNQPLTIYTIELPPCDFGTPLFYDVMQFKVDMINRELHKSDVTHIIYFDSDIAVLGDAAHVMLTELGDRDILFQRDQSTYCAGMFVAANNAAVQSLFSAVAAKMKSDRETYEERVADQSVLNDIIHSFESLKHDYLSDKFTTYGNIGNDYWSGQKFTLNEDVVAFHANFTVGEKNKKQLLKFVKTIK